MDVTRKYTQQDMLQYHQQRYTHFKKTPFITRLQNNSYLDNEDKRKKFLACVTTFGQFFQKFTLTRLATCANEPYSSIFYEHYREELGHDTMLEEQPNVPTISDATLEALSNWFSYQMIVCDNIEKAAIHLVLETSGDHYHKAAEKSIGGTLSNDYYKIHANCEEKHINLVENLFNQQTHETYANLLNVVKKSWDVIIAMNARMIFLIDSNRR